MTSSDEWRELSARGGLACHDLVGWLMWDEAAIARYADLGVPNGLGWIVGWRMASLGDAEPAVAVAAAYSMDPKIVNGVLQLLRDHTDNESVLAARDASIEPGLESIAPGLFEQLGPVAEALWAGVDAVHVGARPMFAAHRARPRPEPIDGGLSAWLAANCLRELRGDNHWALCAAADLDAVEVGLLHSAMVDPEEYGGEEWIARSRGNDDAAVAGGWQRLADKGFARGGELTETGRTFRWDLERRTDELTAPAWQAVGRDATETFCAAVEAHHDAFVARIDATAGPRWMPAVRTVAPPG